MSAGGEGGIRTRGAFAHRFSRAAPSTTRTPLRGRGYQTGPWDRSGAGAWDPSAGRERLGQPLRLVAPDAADDLDPARQTRVLGELDDRSRRAVAHVGDAEHECLDVALEQGADAHRAGLLRGEDR